MHISSMVRTASVALLLGFGATAAMAEPPADPKAVKKDDSGKYIDAKGDPTFSVGADGKVDWYTYSGQRRYGACLPCHGPEADGSTFAPSLKNGVKNLNYAEFFGIVVGGRKGATNPNSVMPAWGEDPNVMCYLDDIYVYLRARSVDAVPPGKPGAHEDKPEKAAEAEQACVSQKKS